MSGVRKALEAAVMAMIGRDHESDEDEAAAAIAAFLRALPDLQHLPVAGAQPAWIGIRRARSQALAAAVEAAAREGA